MTQHRRPRGDGGYYKRGDSWVLKFRVTDSKTGNRDTRYVTFRGTETAARTELRRLLKAADDGAAPPPARQTLSSVIDAWDSGLNVSAKTAERYRELTTLYIRPHLGALKVPSVRASRLESFYADLREGRGPKGEKMRPLAPRTVHHVHRLVVQILSLAVRDGLLQSNPAIAAKRPQIEREEIEILSEAQVREVLQKLHGRSIYRIAALGLATGMRRGELCALRWKDVDLGASTLRVEQSLEQTKTSLRFKAPKTKRSRRTISLPPSVVTELRKHRREQTEQRLKLGLGREPDDALVFRHVDPDTLEARPLNPNSVTTEWRRLVSQLDLPKVSLHAWRHTHASQLIASGMDVLTISRRLGHAAASITLDVYGHLFKRQDDGAAAVFEAAFASVLSE